jgi:transcriptional regulator with GAF, ATPase, and Fis domain
LNRPAGSTLSFSMVVSRAAHSFGTMVASSEPFARMLLDAQRAAASEAGVLVLGETGTGKEVLARAIHSASRRKDGPFVVVDCAALPTSTLQSELFGHRRGAFSGAERDRIGRFEAAEGGTLFFDQIDELEPSAQGQLLRAIEEREVLPLGEARARPVDFRLLSSAGPDLREKVARGRFRSDLYYRIKVVELELPPLRRRPEDIPLLAGLFLEECSRRFAKPLGGFTPRAMEVLARYDWPGNVRELGSAVEAAAAAARGELIQESDLPVPVRVGERRLQAVPPAQPAEPAGPEPQGPLQGFAERVEDFQRSLLISTLARNLWHHREAARELGLERHQLKYLCAKLDIRRGSRGPNPS